MKKIVLLLSAAVMLTLTGCTQTTNNKAAAKKSPRNEVADELVGAWENGSIDLKLWENYREGYYAGRNATPSRELMIISKNGEAKFYRYEFAFGVYEELIECTGTVTFNNDGTFTFYPVKGRRRYYHTRYAPNNSDRALTSKELVSPKLAGKRKYTYVSSSTTPYIQITVPGSATYNWYKKSLP